MKVPKPPEPSLRDRLVRELAVISTKTGSAYRGILFEVDATGFKVVAPGGEKIVWTTGDGNEVMIDRGWLFIPAGDVEVVQVL